MAWQARQKGLIKMYQRYAGLPDAEYRELLHQQTGATSSTMPHLTQFHFDAFMPLLEIRAHLAETNGVAVGPKPGKIADWYYWRNRSPQRGKVNTRILWKVKKLWCVLRPTLPAENQVEPADADPPYVLEMASHATGKYVKALRNLTHGQAHMLVEALKDRVAHAARNQGAA